MLKVQRGGDFKKSKESSGRKVIMMRKKEEQKSEEVKCDAVKKIEHSVMSCDPCVKMRNKARRLEASLHLSPEEVTESEGRSSCVF
ncbi:hypothetical protein E2C01_025289 [Portunus trituberculatus]|uniref:Uncharacterized protein n=1 Tax=Portunus trituberculatus TaxID=210409 RepID=A0A5B7EF70_PORTR|nr:hypothetical protein [Portunus trituberculatus]